MAAHPPHRAASPLLLGLLAGVCAVAPALAEEAPRSLGGFRATVDPSTGEFLKNPPPQAAVPLTPGERNAASRSHEGLVVRPHPQGNGEYVDLQGRFQSPLMATVGPDGKIIMFHAAPEAPAAGATDRE